MLAYMKYVVQFPTYPINSLSVSVGAEGCYDGSIPH